MRLVFSTVLAAALTWAVVPSPASAQALTFVSQTGSDGNPCTAQNAPCKTLQRAVNATQAGGEVRLLSSLTSQTLSLTKSLTVAGEDHTAIASITIGGSSTRVTLRSLHLAGRNALAFGVKIANASTVRVENCAIDGYTENGILVAANISPELFITDSVASNNSANGLYMNSPSGAKTTIDNSHFDNNTVYGIRAAGQGVVSRSVASGNYYGINLESGSMTVRDTVVAGNVWGIVTSGDLTLASVTVRDNSQTGVYGSSTGALRLSKSTITNNGIGVNVYNGTGFTTGDNVIGGNATNVFGNNLQPLALQ